MNKVKTTYAILWIGSLMLAALIVIGFTFTGTDSLFVSNLWLLILILALLSAFCEYVDNSIGMGYGTVMFPVLLVLGLPRQEIVPALLTAQMIAGICGGIAHHREGNVNIRSDKNIHKALWILGIPSFAGAVIAAVLGIKLKDRGEFYLNMYIGIMIASIGLFLICRNYIRKLQQVSRPGMARLVLLGLLASFNKGVSGGGYGPLMMGGQVFAGVCSKDAIVITNLCESFTCLVALVAYILLGGTLNIACTAALCAGSLLTVIPAAKTVKIMSGTKLKHAIGWMTFFLGLIILCK